MSKFQVGVAVREITPAPGAPLWGYTEREGAATGTLDPLFAKAVVFHAGGQMAAVVALDLGRVPLEDGCDRIRARARETGVDYVFLTATHTHHAPVMEAGDASYVAEIESKIGDCIEAAARSVQPARIGVGHAMLDIAHNRRKILEDGRCLMIWRNESRAPTEPVDREATLIQIVAETGEPLAVLVHFACHPVVVGQSNLEYSADYPGEMARIVKEQTGLECVFIQGACGNINPYLDKTPIAEGGIEAMRSVGRTCAEAIVPALDKIVPVAPAFPALAFSHSRVPVGTRWDLGNPDALAALRAAHGPMFDVYAGDATADLAVPLNVLLLNNRIALVGIPGEIFVQYQLALKAGAPAPHALLCGYTGGYYAYFPTVKDAVAGGYGGALASFVGLGAADKLLTEAEIEIARLAGKANPVCTLEDFVLWE